jgi:hypothetical protein
MGEFERIGAELASGMGFPPSMKASIEYHSGFEVVKFSKEFVHPNLFHFA